MTGLLEGVTHRIDQGCQVKGALNKDGCRIKMTDAPARRLVVDFDKLDAELPADAQRCGYLMVAESENARGWVAVLELKRGRLHAGQVVRQLQGGASVAEKLVPRDVTCKFRPIAASGEVSRHELRELKSERIRFRKHREAVRLMKCGENLVTALR